MAIATEESPQLNNLTRTTLMKHTTIPIKAQDIAYQNYPSLSASHNADLGQYELGRCPYKTKVF